MKEKVTKVYNSMPHCTSLDSMYLFITVNFKMELVCLKILLQQSDEILMENVRVIGVVFFNIPFCFYHSRHLVSSG